MTHSPRATASVIYVVCAPNAKPPARQAAGRTHSSPSTSAGDTRLGFILFAPLCAHRCRAAGGRINPRFCCLYADICTGSVEDQQMRPIKTTALIAAALMALASTALAQAPAVESANSYPQQLVKIVVPFSAGSVTDGLARIIADKLAGHRREQARPSRRHRRRRPAGRLHPDADLERAHHCWRHQQEHTIRSGEGLRRREQDRVGADGRGGSPRPSGQIAQRFHNGRQGKARQAQLLLCRTCEHHVPFRRTAQAGLGNRYRARAL